MAFQDISTYMAICQEHKNIRTSEIMYEIALCHLTPK